MIKAYCIKNGKQYSQLDEVDVSEIKLTTILCLAGVIILTYPTSHQRNTTSSRSRNLKSGTTKVAPNKIPFAIDVDQPVTHP